MLKRIVPALSTVCELRGLRRIERSLLDTYVGPASRERVLAGHIRRGDCEMIEAALMFLRPARFHGALEPLAGRARTAAP